LIPFWPRVCEYQGKAALRRLLADCVEKVVVAGGVKS